jgi:hypothetical protein
MPVNANQPIELNKLSIVTEQKGLIGTETVKISTPSACTQPNGPGQLRRFETLSGFRSEAKSLGSQFRKALASR